MNPMYKWKLSRKKRCSHRSFLAPLCAFLAIAAASVPGAAQLERKGQITEKFAAGRVVFCVADHGILVAAVGDRGAPARALPVIVPIGSKYIGVLLGAVELDSVNPADKPTRLDFELPRVAATAARRTLNPRPDELNDIEKIGIATLELIRPLAERLHDKLNLGPDQPFFELLLADYAVDYGPEVWSLQYRIRQESLGNDYWNTRLLRPAYYQLYPPEKSQPRTLVEAQYPKRPEPGLLDQLARHDPALDAVIASSEQMAQAVAAIREGKVQKISPAPFANFLKAALPKVANARPGLVMALLDDRLGFQWQIPPAQPLPPPPADTKTREPGAPTLRQYTPPE